MLSLQRKMVHQVVILDDHPIISKALGFSLAEKKGIRLVKSFRQRAVLFSYLREKHVDVLVLEYLLGEDELDGLQMIKQLRQHHPRLNILVLSSMEKPAIVQLLMKAGVCGFVGKSEEMDVVIKAIEQVASGQSFLTPKMVRSLEKFQESDKEMRQYVPLRSESDNIMLTNNRLSPREIEVIRCFMEGMSISQIAAKYARSRKTISGQKQTALRKLGLRSDIELFKYSDYFRAELSEERLPDLQQVSAQPLIQPRCTFTETGHL